jgi:hypothetical protein
MKPWKYIAAWAALLALWAVLQVLFSPSLITLALLGGAALAVAVFALVVARGRRSVREAPDLSPATPMLALGAGTLVSGAELGTWCILLGALLVACGLAALAVEVRR